MSTNGSTAIECGGAAKAAEVVSAREAASGAAEVIGRDAGMCSAIRILSMTKYVNATRTATAMIARNADLDRQDARADSPIAAAVPEAAPVGGRIVVVARTWSGDSSRRTCSTKADGVSPAGTRVHCTSLNASGTIAS
jgi:hypothetical protein